MSVYIVSSYLGPSEVRSPGVLLEIASPSETRPGPTAGCPQLTRRVRLTTKRSDLIGGGKVVLPGGPFDDKL